MAYRSVREGAVADTGRAITMAAAGAMAFAPVEYLVTLTAYAGDSSVASKLRLAALVATLAAILFLLLATGLAVAMTATRAVVAQLDPAAARRPGWFVPTPLDDGIRRGVPRVWAATATAMVLVVAVQRAAAAAMVRFKEPQLTAALIAGIALVAVGVAPLLFRAFARAATLGGRALVPLLGIVNPLGRWRSAGVALAALVGGALAASWFALPQSRSVLPVRLVASAVVIALGAGIGALVHAHRGRRAHRRPGALVLAAISLALTTTTFVSWGADLETKYIAITASPALDRLIGVVRVANDLDRDGFGTVLGEADCAPLDRAINPGAIDKPDDGIDQNCDGRDFTLAATHVPAGPTVTVPPQFDKPWNVLLLTIDTVRYDRTTFGGYATGPKKRDTTPRLAELVKRSTSFTFANAPSAGTMASIPAILTSKFFHSGIALGPDQRGKPPKLLPENTTLPELMKAAGYRTGAIGSHEWWNDWGLEQGVDDFDNSIGKTSDPYRIAADKVTDHALAWISRHQSQKWFLWAHYIDPHGRYVAHPNVVDYGATESDLYDAELRWTDQEVGRLLDELRRLPSHGNTIIVITSDHGDSMAEHNVPLGTHGTALYREMLHVPMVFYIPDNAPHTIGGAVTPLDIVPTLVELCKLDPGELTFEGQSLVPALFAGREDRDRIVFAETNAGQKQRAAISATHKLIYYLQTNVYELFDLSADPWEHTNLAPRNPPTLAPMKQALQQWMERVVYARDPVFNQSFRKLADVLVNDPPPIASQGQALAGGAIEIAGLGPVAGQRYAPGAKTEVHVYFATTAPCAIAFRFQLVVWPRGAELTDPLPPVVVRSPMKVTAEGALPTTRWRPGDRIRERFAITLPADWTAAEMVVGLVAADVQLGTKAHATGAVPATDPTIAILGVLPVELPAHTGSSGSPSP